MRKVLFCGLDVTSSVDVSIDGDVFVISFRWLSSNKAKKIKKLAYELCDMELSFIDGTKKTFLLSPIKIKQSRRHVFTLTLRLKGNE